MTLGHTESANTESESANTHATTATATATERIYKIQAHFAPQQPARSSAHPNPNPNPRTYKRSYDNYMAKNELKIRNIKRDTKRIIAECEALLCSKNIDVVQPGKAIYNPDIVKALQQHAEAIKLRQRIGKNL